MLYKEVRANHTSLWLGGLHIVWCREAGVRLHHSAVRVPQEPRNLLPQEAAVRPFEALCQVPRAGGPGAEPEQHPQRNVELPHEAWALPRAGGHSVCTEAFEFKDKVLRLVTAPDEAAVFVLGAAPESLRAMDEFNYIESQFPRGAKFVSYLYLCDIVIPTGEITSYFI